MELPKDMHLEGGEKPRLLIVEDHEDVIEYLTALLEEHYQIDSAGHGKEGLEKAIEEVPDLILSDVMMPVMDGFDMLLALRADLRTSHIPVILLTARADHFSRLKGLERGADAYLSKPFSQEELFIRLRKLIEVRRNLQEFFSGKETSFQTRPEHKREAAFLKKVRQLLVAHLGDEEFGVAQLCRELHMSRSQLYRKFQALTNTGISKYMRTLRLQKARELLQTTSMNVTEAALEVGFKNLSHFSRAFTDEFGHNPSEVTGAR